MNIKLLNDTKCPKLGRQGDAGYDFFLNQDIKLKPRQQIAIDTGVCVELPKNYAALFELRSSTCNKHRHLILKNPLIDSNYRGELHLIVYNDSFVKTIRFKKDERIASMFVFPVYTGELKICKELTDSNRGSNWNGSSGK